MRKILLLICLLLPSVPIAAADHSPTLVVTEIYATPDTDREFIELFNPGENPLQLQGYTLQDNTQTNIFTFPAWSLGAAERVVVWGGGEGNGLGPAWSRATVWNAAGDTVWVRDPGGALVAWAWYGSSTEAPTGHSSASRPAATEAGVSLHYEGSWMAGAPSPGFAADGNGGQASASVQELPPIATLTGPASARAETTIQVTVSVQDDNGNLQGWDLHAGQTLLAQGTISQAVQLSVPKMSGAWSLTLVANDDAGNSASSELTLQVRLSDLQVTSSLDFGSIEPGQVNALATGFITVQNIGDELVRPRLDVSPLRGAGEIPVNANLILHVNGVALAYGAGLTTLGELEPGATMQVTLTIQQVPIPLAAGHYTTSFTVIA